jgi:tryptophan halogenase
MKTKQVNNIVIIGGGSAAYLTAALLSFQLPHRSITMVLPKDSKPIGVGEATLVNFWHFLSQCGVTDEHEWLTAVDGTIKNGILFKNWRPDGLDIWHPFQNITRDSFANIRNSNLEYSDILKMLPNYDINVTQEIPTEARGYHLNALKLVTYLHTLVSNRSNVKIVNDRVVSVEIDIYGDIVKLNGEVGNILGDLFIDSSGLNGVSKLLPKQMQSSFIDCSDYLTCNAAVAAPLDYQKSGKRYHPYTKASANEHGWFWETPLQTRMGSGLVYNRDTTTKQEAEDFMLKHYEKAMLADFNHISFTPGFVENQWRNNFVSIGMSSGFIEPLESSGIALSCDAAFLILTAVKMGFYNRRTAPTLFNSIMQDKFMETTAFVGGHYNIKRYDSKFWNLASNKKQAEHLLNIKEKYYSDTAIDEYYNMTHSIFAPHSWVILFEGFNFAYR